MLHVARYPTRDKARKAKAARSKAEIKPKWSRVTKPGTRRLSKSHIRGCLSTARVRALFDWVIQRIRIGVSDCAKKLGKGG